MTTATEPRFREWRPLLALTVFAAWLAVTQFSSRLWTPPHGPRQIAGEVATAIQPQFILALLLLLGAVAIFRWRDVGLNRVREPSSWRLLWFPALYVCLFAAAALVVGAPPPQAIAIIAANTALVGMSEELACRGVLYQGLQERLAVWPAVLLSSLLFGASHVLNGFETGDFQAAAVQAVAAAMSGVAFMAIRLRTGSLIPAMLIHGLWDFTLIAGGAGPAQQASAPDAALAAAPWILLLPIALVTPNFLYGLFLLRHAAKVR